MKQLLQVIASAVGFVPYYLEQLILLFVWLVVGGSIPQVDEIVWNKGLPFVIFNFGLNYEFKHQNKVANILYQTLGAIVAVLLVSTGNILLAIIGLLTLCRVLILAATLDD